MRLSLLLTFLFLSMIVTSCIGQNSSVDEHSFFRVISSSFAKEYCSCFFVENHKDAYCKSYASQVLPVSSYNINPVTKETSAIFMGITSRAVFVSKKLGCQLN